MSGPRARPVAGRARLRTWPGRGCAGETRRPVPSTTQPKPRPQAPHARLQQLLAVQHKAAAVDPRDADPAGFLHPGVSRQLPCPPDSDSEGTPLRATTGRRRVCPACQACPSTSRCFEPLFAQGPRLAPGCTSWGKDRNPLALCGRQAGGGGRCRSCSQCRGDTPLGLRGVP